MLYPLKFKPLYKDYIWGGRNLERLGKVLPSNRIVAESWEVSTHKNGTSIVANGVYEGMPLTGLLELLGRHLVGSSLPCKDIKKFPLLVKFIDAEDSLSVQVHPDDDYAFLNENGEYGKNEMWYIIHAKPGAKLVYDLIPGTTHDIFAKALSSGNITDYLKTVEVFPGDVINIPAGLVHAAGKGILLAEVQQNSDTTYRIYDNGRTGRPLHIDKALNVIDFNSAGRKEKYPGIKLNLGRRCSKRVVVANKHFCTEIYSIEGKVSEDADGSKFFIFTFIAGSCTINWSGGDLTAGMGESVLIPAAMGPFSLDGSFTALKAYVPDLEKDVIVPLLSLGKSAEEIYREVGGLQHSGQAASAK